MRIFVQDVRPVTGTACGREVLFIYDEEGDESTLVLGWDDGTVDCIDDRNVVGVIYEARGKRPSEVQPQLILRVDPSQPEVTKTRFGFETLPVTNLPLSYLEAQLITGEPEHLYLDPSEDGSPNLHIIVSIRSGVGEAQQFFDDVLKEALSVLNLGRDSYVVHTTTSDKTVTEMAASILLPRANKGIAQTVILLSGDGGIVDIINVLLSAPHTPFFVKPTIALLSMGTGNAMANSTGLNLGLTRGLRTVCRGARCNLPIFKCTFSPGSVYVVNEGHDTEPLAISSDSGLGTVYGAVVCSWALHASLVADSDTTAYRKYGSQRFQMAAKELLEPPDGTASHTYQGKITLFKTNKDGVEYAETLETREHSYILGTLVSKLEEKFTISPHSQPLDGQLRFLHLGSATSADVTKVMRQAFQGGGHVDDEKVTYVPIDGFRIDFQEEDSRWQRVCVDGRIIRVGEGGWVEVRKEERGAVDLVADIRA